MTYRRCLQWLLYRNWRTKLPRAERFCLDYWGATGNSSHHPYSWAE